MPIHRQFADAIRRIAEPRAGTAAATSFTAWGREKSGHSDGKLQAKATLGSWDDIKQADVHVNTKATLGSWPEDWL